MSSVSLGSCALVAAALMMPALAVTPSPTPSPTNASSTLLDVSLGDAAGFAVLAYSTITSTGFSVIYGDMGLYPGTAYTGFPPAIVVGDILATTSEAIAGQADALIAYNDAASREVGVTMTSTDLGGLSLGPNVYKWDAEAALSSGDLYLDAGGDIDAVWIFQVGTTLTIASGSKIYFTSGLGNQDNVFWQVGSTVAINTGCTFIGDVVAYALIAVKTGASVFGHLISLNGAVTLQNNVVSVDGVPTPTPTTSSDSSSSTSGLSGASIGIIAGGTAAGLLAIGGAYYAANKYKAGLNRGEARKATEFTSTGSITEPV